MRTAACANAAARHTGSGLAELVVSANHTSYIRVRAYACSASVVEPRQHNVHPRLRPRLQGLERVTHGPDLPFDAVPFLFQRGDVGAEPVARVHLVGQDLGDGRQAHAEPAHEQDPL
ncbi:hypothetical protein ACQP2K_22860 [Microbispora siamensis]